ncbi:MAG: hypothetical protein KKE44_20695 [Proteobacteria bacterium]|nr:hypothetical protein [Pseudomonadota bacterium]MBU1585150.1 hypothetical protein [Pseudomonadota bacterium]MBU2454463.1 hypothetical protein [Pseudomonadota bacterium]MBU2629276.1 hypothetical protein [Pseudomonadota bacterium]
MANQNNNDKIKISVKKNGQNRDTTVEWSYSLKTVIVIALLLCALGLLKMEDIIELFNAIFRAV